MYEVYSFVVVSSGLFIGIMTHHYYMFLLKSLLSHYYNKKNVTQITEQKLNFI